MAGNPHTKTFLIDRDGSVIMASSGAARLLGCQPADLEGCRLHELLDSPRREVVEAFLRSSQEGERPARLAVAIRLSAGRVAEADLRLERPGPVAPGRQGVSGGILVSLELRADAREPEPVEPESIDGEAVLICREDTILHAGEAAAGMIGVPAARLAGLTVKDLVEPEDLLPVVERIRLVERGETPACEFGFRLARSGGRPPLEVAARVRAVAWRGGPSLMIRLRDISRELRHARFATRRIEHLSAALAASGDAVIVLGDPSDGWRVIMVTAGVGNLFDRDTSSWPGRPFREVWKSLRSRFADPETEERIWLGMLDEGESIQVDNVSLSGTPARILERSCAPMRDASGSIIGRICTFRDVTRRSQAEGALLRSREEARRAREQLEVLHQELLLANEGLEKRMAEMRGLNENLRSLAEMRSNLLANVSHDLQTPLVSVRALTEMILKGTMGEVNADQRSSLETALRNIDRLIALIKNLLTFARDEARREALQLETFELDSLVAEAAEVVRESASARGVVVRTSVPGGIPVLADREKMLRVLTNLLGNAIRYNRDGGRVTVEVEDPSGPSVRVRVRDTGVGISAEELDRIFDRGYRVRGASSEAGDGLGLAIARDLLREHGCAIRVESEVGTGSVFTFTVPRDRPADRRARSRGDRGGAPVAGRGGDRPFGSPRTGGARPPRRR